jgi:cell division transport system permease protein
MRHIAFFISEALIGIKRSALMMFIAGVTIMVTLLVFGLFLLMSANMNNLAHFISSKLEVRVFLNESITRRDIEDFQIKIGKMDHVKSVTFVDKEEAWTLFKGSFSNMTLTDLVSENPLPHALKVVLVNNEYIKDVATKISEYEEYTSDVAYGGVIAERMNAFSAWLSFVGVVLVVFLTIATLFIIVNTIRLTVMNRKDEIEIMSLVGATSGFISGPFIIEGLLLGGGSSFISMVLLRFFYDFFAKRFQEALPYFPLVFQSSVLNEIYFFVFLLGAILGVLGAYISISRLLKETV